MYVPIVDLGATNVAQAAPRTSVVAAAAKISVLIDVGAALVWTSGSLLSAAVIVLYIVVSMIVGIACAAIVRSVRLPLEVARRAARARGRLANATRLSAHAAIAAVADARLALKAHRGASGAPYAGNSAHIEAQWLTKLSFV